MKGFQNIFDNEEDFDFGDTSSVPDRPASPGSFDVEPFNFGSNVSISGFGARARPIDLKLSNTVGDGEVNYKKDVVKTRRLLTASGNLVPAGRSAIDPNGDVNLGIFKLQKQVGAKQDGFMRPGGETVTNALKTLFGASGGKQGAGKQGTGKQGTAKPTPTGLPRNGAPATSIDAFNRASRASLATMPNAKPFATPVAAGGSDGIVIGGSVMEQTEGQVRRAAVLGPRGYRYFPKMGDMEAHWVGPDLLPVTEAQVQGLMRKFTAESAKQTMAKPATATGAEGAASRNATLGGKKVTRAGQGDGAITTKSAPGSEAAVRGKIDRAAHSNTVGSRIQNGPGSEAATRPPSPAGEKDGPVSPLVGAGEGPTSGPPTPAAIRRKFLEQTGFIIGKSEGGRVDVRDRTGATIVTVPSTFAKLLAHRGGKAGKRLQLLAEIASGKLRGDDLNARARSLFVKQGTGLDENLLLSLGDQVDREKMEAIGQAAVQLKEGIDPRVVAKVLTPTLLPEGLSSERAVVEFLKDLIPIYGEYRSARQAAINYKQMVASLERGDTKGAVAAGLFGVLATAGAVPGFGKMLKPFGRAVRRQLLKTPGIRRAHARFALGRAMRLKPELMKTNNVEDVLAGYQRLLQRRRERIGKWSAEGVILDKKLEQLRGVFGNAKGLAGELRLSGLMRRAGFDARLSSKGGKGDFKVFDAKGKRLAGIDQAIEGTISSTFGFFLRRRKGSGTSLVEGKVDRSILKRGQVKVIREFSDPKIILKDSNGKILKINRIAVMRLPLDQIPEAIVLSALRKKLVEHKLFNPMDVKLILSNARIWHRTAVTRRQKGVAVRAGLTVGGLLTAVGTAVVIHRETLGAR